MLYYSTNKKAPVAGFKEATIKGLAPDNGLYYPRQIPQLPKGFIDNLSNLSKAEIAYTVIKPYVGDAIPKNVLQRIAAETVNFNFPLVKINDRISSLELFYGPTLAFKDVGARFMSRCLGYFVQGSDRNVTVLVATSGDTGGAVANGFYNVQGVNVVILYPSGKVSSVQEQQLTTLGNNITAIEIDGNFDDCQQLVKQAFADAVLNDELFLTSANSINVARWLPQQFYYYYGYQQWADKSNPPVVCVPSGNFGNICAGMIAHVSGLPVQHFIAACNANASVTEYLETGLFQSKKAVPTISNAMDVGNPSNFVRILELYGNQYPQVKQHLSSYSVSDIETRTTLKQLYDQYHYLADPHGAVAFNALEKYLQNHPGQKGIILETAHPVKFYDVVEPVIGSPVPMPHMVSAIMSKKKESIFMQPVYSLFKEWLLS